MLRAVWTKAVRDRWRGMFVGTVSLALLFLGGMAVYRDIDLSIYENMPEAFRALADIPEQADVASLSYGAIYRTYGMLTLAGLAIAAGSAAVAGEERDGTLGLLLANPRSRTHVLASKAAALVLLTTLGTLVLWAAGVVSPAVLDVDITGVHVGALVVHMYANALLHGTLALALGAWTGRRGSAAGVATGVLVVSWFAAGLLPLVGGLADLARVSPWYYYEAGRPLQQGVQWGHLGVLTAGIALCAAAAVVGVNRRDLRERSVGVELVDRLRANPLTRTVADRLAGSTRVSHLWVKTTSDHQGLLVVTSGVMAFLGVVVGPLYNAIDQDIRDLTDQLPEAMLALVGGVGDLSTPEGFYQVEIFGLMAPIATTTVAVVVGARALAGEEASRTMGLLLANPVPRSVVVVHKAVAMVALTAVVGAATGVGSALGSVLGGLGIGIGGLAAVSALATLVGLVFGALALSLGAATGRTSTAVAGTVGVALACYLANALLPLTERLGGYARLSPFHYYLGGEPLSRGMPWGHAALLAALATALVAASIPLFERRDLRQG